MGEYNGPERRQRTDFEREQIEFMAEMREHMRNQTKRCESHAADIRALDARQTITEQAIQYEPDAPTIGQRTVALETAIQRAIGAAITLSALGSVGYAGFELWRYCHP